MDFHAKSQRIDITTHDELALALCDAQQFLGRPGHPFLPSTITLTRCDPATAKQLAYFKNIMHALEKNVLWHGVAFSAYEWRDLLFAAWRREFVVTGLLGGLAYVGGDASDLSRQQCSEILYIAEEFMSAIELNLASPPPSPISVYQLGYSLADLVINPETGSCQGSTPAVQSPQSIRRWGTVRWYSTAPTLDELS